MLPLSSLLVEPRTVIGIQSDFLEFVQLQHPLLSRGLQVEVEVFYGPVSPVFQFYEEMTRLAVDEPKGGGANGGFERRAVGPKGVIKLVRPILS